jgi:hypothetical protein
MTLHKSKMQRKTRDGKQERKFLFIIVCVAVTLMLALYVIFGN